MKIIFFREVTPCSTVSAYRCCCGFYCLHHHPKAGRTRTDKIGVGAGADIGGTGISCNFIAMQYTGPTRQSYRDDHRHVGAMPATPSINRPAFSHFGPCSPHLTPSVCTTRIRSSIIGPGTKIMERINGSSGN